MKKTELHKKMEVIDDGMKKLKALHRKRRLKIPRRSRLCGEIIDAATACRDMTPSKAAKLPEADRKKFIDDYKASMTKLIDTMEPK